MQTAIVTLTLLAAIAPLGAILWNKLDKGQLDDLTGYDRTDYLANPEGIAWRKRQRIRNTWMVGAGAFFAIAAVLLSIG